MSRSVSHVGAHFLEREGLRAIAGQEQQESEEQGVALQGSLGHSLRVVSVNVDGLGNSYGPLRPPDRMKAILKAVLVQRPTVILLQEVIDSMHRVLLDVLDPLGWVVKKRRCTSEAYFVVSAVSALAPESLV